MASVNKAIIIGNVVADAEKRHFADGTPVANVRVATNMQWTDAKTGEKKEEVEYHNVVFRAKLADVAGDYLKKGMPVYVEGRLRTRKYKDKNEVERYATEIIGERMQMLGSVKKSDDDRVRDTAVSRKETSKRDEAGADEEEIPF
jgi:single-strand DNA-binding protein